MLKLNNISKNYYMRYVLFINFCLFIHVCLYTQVWSVSTLPDMPEPVTNNAVCEAMVNDTMMVYSFSGIDTSKSHNGIHLKSYRFNTLSQQWITLPSLPDTMGKIAASAVYINDRIYIFGGYHVTADGNEYSSDKVHVFNPETNQFENDAMNIPTSIDDHVQAVWRDSLVYIITGWSNTGNVSDIQIFDPFNNSWTVTNTPNTNQYKVFGASGTIIGDTIYYFGGAAYAFNFPGQNVLRKGIINPNNPADILWSFETNIFETSGYRMAASNFNEYVFWLGGSSVTYNYNGIAYNGSGGVSPLGISYFMNTTNEEVFIYSELPFLMDFRGIAKINSNQWITSGGMNENQEVVKSVYLYQLDEQVGITKESIKPMFQQSNGIIDFENRMDLVEIFDIQGKKMISETNILRLKLHLKPGVYFIKYEVNNKRYNQKLFIQSQ